MLRNLLAERFRLKLRIEQKETATYELTVAADGAKLKPAQPGDGKKQDRWTPPEYTVGKDGFPVFAKGTSGLAGASGSYRWVGFGVSMPEIADTLSFHTGRPVVDATGLKGEYDIDLRWVIDVNWVAERAGIRGEVPDVATPHGPTLIRAVREQLGLKLTAKKGAGKRVVVEHVGTAPIGN